MAQVRLDPKGPTRPATREEMPVVDLGEPTGGRAPRAARPRRVHLRMNQTALCALRM
jgi:hypothetical protein